jgi:DNA polymerase-1
MKALIDADIIIYEAASLCEKTIPWPYGDDGEVLWTRHAHMDEAWARLNDSIDVLAEKVGADEVVLCVTDTENFRFDFYGDYKSNRKSGVKPMLVSPLRDRIANDPRGYRRPKLEGDDIMGILQTMPGAGDVISITIDKDLKTIPGRHYNFRQDHFFEVTEAEANQFHLQQTLMGDATDGFPGCRGIGPKKAENMLPDPVEDVLAAWNEVVVPAYEKAGFDEAFALSQARCARILRASDYNPKKREVIPWIPK